MVHIPSEAHLEEDIHNLDQEGHVLTSPPLASPHSGGDDVHAADSYRGMKPRIPPSGTGG